VFSLNWSLVLSVWNSPSLAMDGMLVMFVKELLSARGSLDFTSINVFQRGVETNLS